MFTIFHTADWHLGQSFHGFERHEEHVAFLSWLRQQLQQHQPQALLIAGDIFDTINPSARSTRLYYEFLADLRKEMPHLHVVVTAGNHDSGSRLEAPADLLASLDIAVVGTIQKDESGQIDIDRLLVPLTNSSGQKDAMVIAMPFLRPSDVPKVDNVDDAYLDGITALYRQAFDRARQISAGADLPIIAIGHCHVQGGSESPDSERRITIGGAEALSTAAFPSAASYVALGHLHKAQKFQSKRICYSGSPIPLSFSERVYEHRVLKVCFDGAELHRVDDLMVPTTVPLITIPQGSVPATLEEVLLQIDQLPDRPEESPEATDNADQQADLQSDDEVDVSSQTKLDTSKNQSSMPSLGAPAFLEVKVLNDGPDPTRFHKIAEAVRSKHVRLASTKLESPKQTEVAHVETEVLSLDDLQTLDAEQIFANAYREKYEGDPDQSILNAFREVLLEVEAGQ